MQNKDQTKTIVSIISNKINPKIMQTNLSRPSPILIESVIINTTPIKTNFTVYDE